MQPLKLKIKIGDGSRKATVSSNTVATSSSSEQPSVATKRSRGRTTGSTSKTRKTKLDRIESQEQSTSTVTVPIVSLRPTSSTRKPVASSSTTEYSDDRNSLVGTRQSFIAEQSVCRLAAVERRLSRTSQPHVRFQSVDGLERISFSDGLSMSIPFSRKRPAPSQRLCAADGCEEKRRYTCPRTLLSFCSLPCYRVLHQSGQTIKHSNEASLSEAENQPVEVPTSDDGIERVPEECLPITNERIASVELSDLKDDCSEEIKGIETGFQVGENGLDEHEQTRPVVDEHDGCEGNLKESANGLREIEEEKSSAEKQSQQSEVNKGENEPEVENGMEESEETETSTIQSGNNGVQCLEESQASLQNSEEKHPENLTESQKCENKLNENEENGNNNLDETTAGSEELLNGYKKNSMETDSCLEEDNNSSGELRGCFEQDICSEQSKNGLDECKTNLEEGRPNKDDEDVGSPLDE